MRFIFCINLIMALATVGVYGVELGDNDERIKVASHQEIIDFRRENAGQIKDLKGDSNLEALGVLRCISKLFQEDSSMLARFVLGMMIGNGFEGGVSAAIKITDQQRSEFEKNVRNATSIFAELNFEEGHIWSADEDADALKSEHAYVLNSWCSKSGPAYIEYEKASEYPQAEMSTIYIRPKVAKGKRRPPTKKPFPTIADKSSETAETTGERPAVVVAFLTADQHADLEENVAVNVPVNVPVSVPVNVDAQVLEETSSTHLDDSIVRKPRGASVQATLASAAAFAMAQRLLPVDAIINAWVDKEFERKRDDLISQRDAAKIMLDAMSAKERFSNGAELRKKIEDLNAELKNKYEGAGAKGTKKDIMKSYKPEQ